MDTLERITHSAAPKPVAEVTSLSREDFNQHYFKKEPLIIRGAIKDSAYFQKWTNEYLKSTLGTRPVMVKTSSNGLYDYANTGEYLDVELPFNNAVDLITAQDSKEASYYMQQVSIPDCFPELLPDLYLPDLNSPLDNMALINFWLGGEGCTTKLHYDRDQNFLVQVRGHKELLMYAPEDSQYLYPHHEKKVEHISQVILDDVDYEKFPLFKNAKLFRCVLNPGDALYLTPYWWHQVRSLDVSISVNYWWNRFDIDESLGLEQMDVDKISRLLYSFTSKGFDINTCDDQGEPLLIKAIQLGYDHVVEAFMILGADPNVTSKGLYPGQSAMNIARELSQDKIVDIMEQYGALF